MDSPTRTTEKSRSAYLFFLDSLIEIFQKHPQTNQDRSKFAYDFFYGIDKKEIYHSPFLYSTPEQAIKYAKLHAVLTLVERLELPALSCTPLSDTVLKQSEESIFIFGNAREPEMVSAKSFFVNPQDRKELILDLKTSPTRWIEKKLVLQSLDKEIIKGVIRSRLIFIAPNEAVTLEVFSI